MSMSMSMFSSFDALCAEYCGQKVSLSRPPFSAGKQDPAKTDDLEKSSGVNSSSQPVKKQEDRRRMRTPRFALELDGLHCFETILPY